MYMNLCSCGGWKLQTRKKIASASPTLAKGGKGSDATGYHIQGNLRKRIFLKKNSLIKVTEKKEQKITVCRRHSVLAISGFGRDFRQASFFKGAVFGGRFRIYR